MRRTVGITLLIAAPVVGVIAVACFVCAAIIEIRGDNGQTQFEQAAPGALVWFAGGGIISMAAARVWALGRRWGLDHTQEQIEDEFSMWSLPLVVGVMLAVCAASWIALRVANAVPPVLTDNGL